MLKASKYNHEILIIYNIFAVNGVQPTEKHTNMKHHYAIIDRFHSLYISRISNSKLEQ